MVFIKKIINLKLVVIHKTEANVDKFDFKNFSKNLINF